MCKNRVAVVFVVSMLAFIFLQHENLYAQGWQWQNPQPQGDNLNVVTFVDRQHGWITSEGPILLRTRNGGKNWEVLRTGIVFTDVNFINSSEGWGIGNARLDVIKWNIYHTRDGGTTWEVQLADTTARNDIFFLDAKHGWVAKDEAAGPDELLFTRDGGKTWEPQARDEFRSGDEIHSMTFLNLKKGWVAAGLVLQTKDGGKTWKRDSTLTGIRQIFFADSLHGWARSFQPRAFRTIDGGQTWKRFQITNVSGEVRTNQFFAFDTSRCFVALNVGLFASTDGGQSWVQHSSQELTSFAFLDAMEAWGVAGNGLYHSIDGGRTWQNLVKNILPDGVTFFSSVDFINAQVGWVAGLNTIFSKGGVILKTVDGGNNWTEQFSKSGMSFGNIVFVDELRGWGVGSGGHIFHTVDGGQSWQQQNSGTDFILRAAAFVDARHGWVVGGAFTNNGAEGIILSTLNGGQLWNNQTPVNTPRLFDVSFVDTLNGWAVGGGGSGLDSGAILRTRNGGKSWVMLRQGVGLELGAIAFTDTLHGWAAGYDPQTNATIIHTKDGGVTWSPQLAESYPPFDIKFIDNQHGWAVSFFGRIYHTTNGGDTWREQQSHTSKFLMAIDFVDTNSGWSVGDFGTILHTTTGGISNVKQSLKTSNLSKHFILYGNYPNPFNAQTKIRFEILQSKAMVRLRIYDLQGHLIGSLIDEERGKGLHEVSWDGKANGAEQASGLYFYRLEVGGITQVGKAVLLR